MSMAKYRYQILAKRGAMEEIAKRMNVTTRTVYNALRYITAGEQADTIRQIAICEFDGVEIKKPL